jgi:hypothetical protein
MHLWIRSEHDVSFYVCSVLNSETVSDMQTIWSVDGLYMINDQKQNGNYPYESVCSYIKVH